MDNPNNKQAARIFASAFAGSITTAVSKAVSGPWSLEVLEGAEPPTRQGKPVHFRLSVEGAAHGECYLEFYEPQVSGLAEKILARPAVDDEAGEAVAGLLSAATAGLHSALAPQYGELSFRLDRVSGLAFGGMLVVPMTISSDTSGTPVRMYFEVPLLRALCAASGSPAPAQATAPGIDPANLRLVMDVELNVSLRFGQRQLPLREVLELNSGSVIELDRMVDEPVELLLDGKLIARGEAVIVDGNYGLRVTEIPQPVASHLLQ
jgi:flagellar motor switch protein FliN